MTNANSAGVLFDVDGTLLDTNYLHAVAWWQAFRDTGHGDVPMSRIHGSIGLSSEELVERLVGKEDGATVEAHSQRFEALRDNVVALPGASDLVRACAERGLQTVVATSGQEKDLDWMLPNIDAGDSLGGATTSAEVERSKPAPDLLEVAMEGHHLDPERTLMIGDTVWDVEAARRAGIRCIGVTSGGISEAELREAGAVEVYDDPAGLLEALESSVLAELS